GSERLLGGHSSGNVMKYTDDRCLSVKGDGPRVDVSPELLSRRSSETEQTLRLAFCAKLFGHDFVLLRIHIEVRSMKTDCNGLRNSKSVCGLLIYCQLSLTFKRGHHGREGSDIEKMSDPGLAVFEPL